MINWTFVGPMLYLFVFQASTPITEYISVGKYPEYKLYQERIGRFIPNIGRPSYGAYVEGQKNATKSAEKPKVADKKQTKKLR